MTDFLDPDQRISQETLDETNNSSVPPSIDALSAFAGLDAKGLRRMTDPATATIIEALADLGDVGTATLDDVGRAECRRLAMRAGRAGYLTGRMVLGTVYEDVLWSTSEADGNALARATGEIDVTLVPLPGPWGMASCDLLEMLARQAGFEIEAEEDPVAELATLAYDRGTTLALLEHDRWKGRTPTHHG